LLPGELAHSVYFAIPPSNTRSGFMKLGRRNALAIARLSAAAVITLDASRNKIIRARVALGAVAPNPFRSEELENLLTGAEISPELIDEAVATASAVVAARLGARPSAPYKREAVKGVVRALLERLLLPVGTLLEGGCVGP
ncbi:MAG: FAD binding domain-containing protein, partial [Moorellaceae bacterium]